MDDVFDVDRLSREVLRVLATVSSTDVVAVWENGTVTVERFAFWSRKTPQGGRELPLASFLAGWGPPTREAIMEQIAAGLVKRGWAAAS